MDALDLIEHINYNGGKQVDYAYNKTGDLVKMDDWSGTTTYEVDLLHQLTATTDRLGKHVAYTYDGVGNQTSVAYPDGTTATKEYDLVHNLTTVIEEDGRTTSYTYDGMRRVTHMDYPDGWQEDYHYDSIGQLLAIEDTDPTQKDMKQQKNTFEYDVCGNMIHEYMRGNGTGETTTDVTYTYDELHRVTSAKELYGNAWRNYQYDSLSNLTWEDNSNSVHYDYKMNNLNQVTEKHYSTHDKEGTVYTYDKRGNLIKEAYGKFNGDPNGQKRQTVSEYTYDETNKMVKGVNSIGESSSYLFNGKNALVEQTWHIAKNGYGYHDVDANIEDTDTTDKETGKGGNGSGGKGHGNGNGQGNGNGSGDKPTGTTVGSFSTVVKQFVIDYTVETMDPLMEHEVNGLDYRYVYGNERLSVNISPIPNGAGHIVESGTVGQQIRLYYHQDLRGTVDYLTSPVSQKVESWTHYNEWGEITHNAVLKTGQRELDLVKLYATHDFDAVLNMYYAKARMYDAENRRFVSIDPILDGTKYDLKDYTTEAINFSAYVYVRDNPLRWVDPLGLIAQSISGGSNGQEAYKNATIYINGQQRVDNYAITANDTTYINTKYLSGLLNIMGNPKYKISRDRQPTDLLFPTGAKYIEIGGHKIYFETFGCIEAIPFRELVKYGAPELEETISWWWEEGSSVITFNPIMLNAPVKLIRQGDQINISVYASFTGDYDQKFDNLADATAWFGGNLDPFFYQTELTYAEEFAAGFIDYWEGPQTERIDPETGIKYDSFGDNSVVFVNIDFYGKQPSSNNIYLTAPDNPNQKYVEVNINKNTPAPQNAFTSLFTKGHRSHETGAAYNRLYAYGKWSISANRGVQIYDHFWERNEEGNIEHYEYDWTYFRAAAAHEMGHVMGLGDAYDVGWHPAAIDTEEVKGPSHKLHQDMMWGNDVVSPNDIEMVLEAFKTNAWQGFSDNKHEVKSPVIRLP